MNWHSIAVFMAAQVNPGLPPPNPSDGPFDISSICFVVTRAEADRLSAQNQKSRYYDSASGFFAAQVAQVHAGRETTSIDDAERRIGDDPDRFRASCADAYAVGMAPFSRSRVRR